MKTSHKSDELKIKKGGIHKSGTYAIDIVSSVRGVNEWLLNSVKSWIFCLLHRAHNCRSLHSHVYTSINILTFTRFLSN
jgi:hypothetical protein